MKLATPFTFVFLAPLATAQTTWYVDINGSSPGSGSQNDPYTSIDYAISMPSTISTDLLLVAPGLYAESIDYRGKAIRVRASGTAQETIITPPGNELAIVVTSGEGVGTELNGFTLEGAMGNTATLEGAAILVSDSTFAMRNCIVRDNVTLHDYGIRGAGLFARASTITVVECVFAHNGGFLNYHVSAGAGMALYDCDSTVRSTTFSENYGGRGGAIYLDGGTLGIQDSLFEGQVCTDPGGGVWAQNANLTVARCGFVENSCSTYPGGAAFVLDCPLAEFVDCSFRENEATSGGAVYISGGGVTVEFTRCDFLGNVAEEDFDIGTGDGGAIAGGAARATSCLFFGNRAEGNPCTNSGRGGAWFGALQLDRCTLVDNVARIEGHAGHSGTVTNSIVWGSSPSPLTGGVTATYSDVEGGWPGVGNIDADPLFWNAAAGDFHLRPGSLCIDVGDPASLPDPDGSRADMGVFPFDPTHCGGSVQTYCPTTTNSTGIGARMDYQGTLSITDNTFRLVCNWCPLNQFGLFFYGPDQTVVPFGDGLRCVGGALHRLPVINTGGAGVAAYWVNFTQPPAGSGPGLIQVGSTWNFQFWFRDPHGGPAGYNASNGLSVTFCP